MKYGREPHWPTKTDKSGEREKPKKIKEPHNRAYAHHTDSYGALCRRLTQAKVVFRKLYD